ncbi:MAG: phosphate uptake regulator PhoU [Candidatus Jordarchaeales archaeon]|nr:phosphate uptake regulator PhoU [Candidatus Jordarchaeia archaeon]
MDVRRIISLGRSSLVVSLPKEWLEFHRLKKGDAVSLSVRRDGALVLSPVSLSEKEDKHVEITVGKDEQFASLSRKIIACYLNGYKSIVIKSDGILSPSQQKGIRKVARMLYLRIMESTSKHMYLEAALDEAKVSLNMSVRRMHSVAYSMCESAVKALEEDALDAARAVYTLDDDVDHFSFFLLRVLKKAIQDPLLAEKLNVDAADCLEYQTLINKIEHTADCASEVARTYILLRGRGKKIAVDVLNLLVDLGRQSLEIYDDAVKAFFSEDLNTANLIIDERWPRIREKSLKVSEGLINETDPYVGCAICSIQKAMEKIGEYAVDIAEIVIDRGFC